LWGSVKDTTSARPSGPNATSNDAARRVVRALQCS
jgi:hypothetical protein